MAGETDLSGTVDEWARCDHRAWCYRRWQKPTASLRVVSCLLIVMSRAVGLGPVCRLDAVFVGMEYSSVRGDGEGTNLIVEFGGTVCEVLRGGWLALASPVFDFISWDRTEV